MHVGFCVVTEGHSVPITDAPARHYAAAQKHASGHFPTEVQLCRIYYTLRPNEIL